MRIRTHPGEMLAEEFLKPLGLSATQLAKELGVPQNRITDIIRGRRGITADTAIRLGRYFDTSAELWTNMQTGYDLSVARAKTNYSEITTTALERTKQRALDLIAEHGLEVRDEPSCQDIANHSHSQRAVLCWGLRIGDPRTNEDIFVESTRGELGLWQDAIQEIKEHLREHLET